jgi:tetratricopeptide (TPR) repeat protein
MTPTTSTARDSLTVAEQLFGSGRLDEAERELMVLLGSELRAEALYGLAMISSKRGDAVRTRSLLEQCLGVKRTHPDALYNLGRVHLADGNRQAAVALFAEALSYAPAHRAALGALVSVAATNGNSGQGAGPPAGEDPRVSLPTMAPAPVVRPPHSPTDPSSIVGVATYLAKGVGPWRGKVAAVQIWTFRVQTYDQDGSPQGLIGVELRGHDISGTLENGDWVEIGRDSCNGGGCHPKEIRNLSTNEAVKARMRWFMAH